MGNKNNLYLLYIVLLLCYHSTNIFAQEYSVVQLFNSADRILHEGINQGDIRGIYEAQGLLHKGLAINPNYYKILHRLAIANFVLGDLRQTQEYLNRAMVLNDNDASLYGINIFIALKENQLERAYELILDAKQKFPNDAYVAYQELLYYNIIDDKINSTKVADNFARKYGADNVYSYIYQIAQVIVEKQRSYEADVIIQKLELDYPNNLWIKWLGTNYYLATEANPEINKTLIYLQETNFDLIATFAFEEHILLAMDAKNYDLVVDIATRYSNSYPNDYKSWYYMGLAYYKLNKLKYAERAINRTLTIVPDFDLIQFIYDTILKEGGTELQSLLNVRVAQLSKNGDFAYREGNIILAQELFERALYINPLETFPRRMLINIYQLQEDYVLAIENILLLMKYGYTEKNLDSLLASFQEKINISNSQIQGFELDTSIVKNRKMWNIELGTINNNLSIYNDSIREFQRKLFEFYFSKSSYINWSTVENPNNADYSLEVNFYPYNNISVVHLELNVKKTFKQIKVFDKFILDERNSLKIYKDISNALDNMMPKFMQISSLNIAQGSALLYSSNKNSSIADKVYELHPNNIEYQIHLDTKFPHYYSEKPMLGNIHVQELINNYSIGIIQNNSSGEITKDMQYYRLLNTISIGDFIVIAPDWTSYTSENDLVNKSHVLYNQRQFNNYLLNVLFIDQNYREKQ